MSKKEKFLSLKSYNEFHERREEVKGLKFDKEILEHMRKIFPKVSNIKEELYKKTRN